MKSEKIKQRPEMEKRLLLNRLKRVSGQVQGLIRMIETDAYCPDVLNQASAARAALASFSRELLEQHLKTCVASRIQQGNLELIDELMPTIKRMTQ